MSDLRVALVAEGPTDTIVIEAALKALLPRPFVLTQLQPESITPKLGGGWGGVLRWCDEFAKRGHAQFEDDPTLPGFNLFVIHVDADVTEKAYTDYGPKCADLAVERGWPALPNGLPCPPQTGSADAMRARLLSWSGLQAVGPRTVLCVPSKAVDAWLYAAVLDNGHAVLNGIECNLRVEARLSMADRIKKRPNDYRTRERAITQMWSVVRQRCSQADRFSTDVAAVFP